MEEFNTLDDNLEVVDETPKNVFTNTTGDKALLAAKGNFHGQDKKAQSDHVFKLSNGILKVMSKHGYAKIRAVGVYAVANAVKAMERAAHVCKRDNDIELYWQVHKEVGNIGELRNQNHVADVGAYMFSLATFVKEKTND